MRQRTVVTNCIDLSLYVHATHGNPMHARLRHLCLSVSGNEISGIMDCVSIFTAGEPWGTCLLDVIIFRKGLLTEENMLQSHSKNFIYSERT